MITNKIKFLGYMDNDIVDECIYVRDCGNNSYTATIDLIDIVKKDRANLNSSFVYEVFGDIPNSVYASINLDVNSILVDDCYNLSNVLNYKDSKINIDLTARDVNKIIEQWVSKNKSHHVLSGYVKSHYLFIVKDEWLATNSISDKFSGYLLEVFDE